MSSGRSARAVTPTGRSRMSTSAFASRRSSRATSILSRSYRRAPTRRRSRHRRLRPRRRPRRHLRRLPRSQLWSHRRPRRLCRRRRRRRRPPTRRLSRLKQPSPRPWLPPRRPRRSPQVGSRLRRSPFVRSRFARKRGSRCSTVARSASPRPNPRTAWAARWHHPNGRWSLILRRRREGMRICAPLGRCRCRNRLRSHARPRPPLGRTPHRRTPRPHRPQRGGGRFRSLCSSPRGPVHWLLCSPYPSP